MLFNFIRIMKNLFVIQILKKQLCDTDKFNILVMLSSYLQPFNFCNLIEIFNCFSTDKWKEDILKLLLYENLLIDFEHIEHIYYIDNIKNIINNISSDDNKINILKLIIGKLTKQINLKQINYILKDFDTKFQTRFQTKLCAFLCFEHLIIKKDINVDLFIDTILMVANSDDAKMIIFDKLICGLDIDNNNHIDTLIKLVEIFELSENKIKIIRLFNKNNK